VSGRAAGLRAAFALVLSAAPLTTVGYLAAGAVTAEAPVASALLMLELVNHLIAHASPTVLAELVAGLAGSLAVTTAMSRVSNYLQNELGRRTGLIADDRIYRAVNALTGLAPFEDPPFLDRIRMAQQAAESGCARMVTGLINVVFAALAVGSYVGFLLVISPELAAALAVSGIALLVAELTLARSRAAVFAEVVRRGRREFFYGSILVSSEAAKEVRLFGIGAFLRGRMRAERVAANARRRRIDRREASVISALSVLAAVVSGVGLLWAVQAAAAGRLNVGDITMFVQSVAGLQLGLAGIVRELGASHENALTLKHYVAVTSAIPDLGCPDPRPLPGMGEGILLRDVWFRYSPDASWVLRGVNLFIPRGKVTALVGKNGSGKSTLVKLLCRFYDPEKGTIYWDGRDLRDIAPELLRQRVSAVFQDFMEYDLTLSENIAVGDISQFGDTEQIATAAAYAGIDGTARDLPYGYGTLLSRMFLNEEDKANPESGVLLSGGQWQRIALARAYLRGVRDLMILDEPSAGLDAEAEYQLQQGLRERCRGGTVLLISHRLSTLTDADQIVVLDSGQISEQGTHAELVVAGGTYARLFELQAQGYRYPATS
jgi:ATP-binding cassette, subfamily B, bacterial